MSPRHSSYLLEKNVVFALEEYTFFIYSEKIVCLQFGNYNSM
jgi:hypothetical protein